MGMDHLKWNSDICEEYLISLRRMNQHLDEEMQKLAAVRKTLLRQGGAGEDEALTAILDRTEKVMKNLTLANDRVRELRDSLANALEIFNGAENRIKGMGMDMMYSVTVSASRNAGASAPLYTTYSGGLRTGEITPEWLSAIIGESASLDAG